MCKSLSDQTALPACLTGTGVSMMCLFGYFFEACMSDYTPYIMLKFVEQMHIHPTGDWHWNIRPLT
jgi:hypothetical protein